MKKKELERILCDTLWDLKRNYKDIELSEKLHYIDTIERVGGSECGIKLILNDDTVFNIIIKLGHNNVDSEISV